MIHTICYLSKAEVLKDSELEVLFEFILKVNLKLKITGALVYFNGSFLQVLEGNKEVITELFSKIRKDKRHSKILTILDQKIDDRIFENYEATFSILRTKEDIERLNLYLSRYNFENKYPKNIQSLIEPFLL